MKQVILFFLLLVGWQQGFSQVPVIHYNYDNAGNRTGKAGAQSSTVPDWVNALMTRCQVNDDNVNTGFVERLERDNNPGSATHLQTRWVLYTYNTATCPLPPNWVNTGNYSCETDGSGYNTGYTLIEQIDNNPGSATYNTTQWVLGDYDPYTCPPPAQCDYYNCDVNGPEYRCVYGFCETGYKVYTYSYYDYTYGMYICYYHYEFSDGSISQEYSEMSYSYCY